MDQDRETKLHEIIRREISRYQISNLYITHITGVLCKIHIHDDKWITGRVLFSRKNGNHAFVYTEPLLSSPWIDFSARSDHAVLFTTEHIFYQNRLARKFRGTIKGLTTMRCFNDGKLSFPSIPSNFIGLYIESFPPDSSSRVVSSSQCQSFDPSQIDNLDPLTRTSLQRELSYISRIRLLITNLLSSAETIPSTSSMAKIGSLPRPPETAYREPPTSSDGTLQSSGNLPENGKINHANVSIPTNMIYSPPTRSPLLGVRGPIVSRINGSVYQPNTSPRPTKLTPQTATFLPQLAPRSLSRPLTPTPTTNSVYPQAFVSAPRGRPPNSLSNGVTSKHPSATPNRRLEKSKSEKRPPLPAPAPPPAPLRYELLNNPFPGWKKELIIPGWISQSEWIGKPLIQYTPPSTVIPLRNLEALRAYLDKQDEFQNRPTAIEMFDFREVFCLCHKPEISEVITYMECLANVAGCNRWFHPECAGWDRFELDQFEDDLICPLCTEYMERNAAVNTIVEKRLYQAYLRNKVESPDPFSVRPFQLMRLKGKGKYYVTDNSGLPEPNQRILRRSQVEQLCPKVIEQGRLEILAFNQPHRVWGISDGDMSFAQSALIPVDEWNSSESSLVKIEDLLPGTDRSYGPLVGTLDSSLIVKRSQLHETSQLPPSPRASPRPSLPQSSLTRRDRFPIPWIEDQSPSLSDSRLGEDIRIATKDDPSGKRSHVFVSIRAGWKAFPSYDAPLSLTHDERVRQSKEAVIPLDQRFVANVIQLGTNAVKSERDRREGGEASSSCSGIDGVVPMTDGTLVTTCLFPGRLPDLSKLYQHNCALCLDSLSPTSQLHQQNLEGPPSKRVRTDPEMVSYESNGVRYLLHSLCSELVTSPELFQAVLNTTTLHGTIQIHGASTGPCELCGRTGGILFQYSRQLSADPVSIVVRSAHAFCLRGLSISDFLIPLDQYQCSLCGLQKGLTFCCSDPTCHRHAHHICAMQAGWDIGSVIVNNCWKKSSRNSNQQSHSSSCVCFLCHDHSLRRDSASGASSSSQQLLSNKRRS